MRTTKHTNCSAFFLCIFCLCTIFNPDGVFFFCFWRRYLVNLSSLSPFKGGGFIVSWDAEVRSRHAGGVDSDNSYCSWDQQEVSAQDRLLQIVYLWRAKRCVFVCVFVLGVMWVSHWRLRIWWLGWIHFLVYPLQSLFSAKRCNFRLFFYRYKMLICIL